MRHMDTVIEKFLELPICSNKYESNKTAWTTVQSQRQGDVTFLLLMSTGIMARTSNGNNGHAKAMETLMAWIVERNTLDVFIAAGLAWVPRAYLPKWFTERQGPAFYKKRETILQESKTQVRPSDTILKSLLVYPVHYTALEKVTNDVTFSALRQLAGYCGMHDKVARRMNDKVAHRSNTSKLLLDVMEKLTPGGPLKELWSKINTDITQFKNIDRTSFAFVYLLTHLVYAFALYSVGFDKEDAEKYMPLWQGLNGLVTSFAGWGQAKLKAVDELVSELIIALYMFSRRADGQPDERFPISSHVCQLDSLTTSILHQQGLRAVETAGTASEVYACVHRSLIAVHATALATWRISVAVTGVPTNDVDSRKRERKNSGAHDDLLERAVRQCGAEGATIDNVAKKLRVPFRQARTRLNEELKRLRPRIHKVEHVRPPKTFGPKTADLFFVSNLNNIYIDV